MSSKGCFFHWWNSDSEEGNEMLLQCLFTNAEQIQCVLKIMFEFMITYDKRMWGYKDKNKHMQTWGYEDVKMQVKAHEHGDMRM